MTKPYQIVLDTNIIASAFRSQRGTSYKLLTVLKDSRWQVNLSTPLVLEYEEVLKRPGMIEGFNDAAIDTFLDGLCAIANRHDIFYLWRPLLGHARYRLPVLGLYLCGSGAHPGGGITGGPGQNAAHEILSDLRRSRGA